MKSLPKSIRVHKTGPGRDLGEEAGLLTLAEAARYLKLSQKTIFRMIRRNELPAAKIGRVWRMRREWIHEWIESKRTTAVPFPDLLKELAKELRSLYGGRLKELYLYGSYARGDARPGSDLDLLVVLDDFSDVGEEIQRTGAVASRLSLEADIVVALMFVRERDFESRQTPFLMNVRQEAKRLAA